MDRRRLLASLGAGLGLLAGCASDETPDSTTTTADTPGMVGTPIPMARLGNPQEICNEPIHADPGIYAITEPAFASDWSNHLTTYPYSQSADDPLPADDIVIGVEREGRARAYPLDVLWYHEVVNDEFGGPLAVTYCPICRSGMVAERVVDGQETTFAVTGLLWQAPREYSANSELTGRVFAAGEHPFESGSIIHSGNLVFYDDATRSYWSQILAQAICGPMTGTTLSLVPSTVATWGEWRAAHPETEVLLPPPHSGTRTSNPAVGPGEQ